MKTEETKGYNGFIFITIMSSFYASAIIFSWVVAFIFDFNNSFFSGNAFGWIISILLFGMNLEKFVVIPKENHAIILKNLLETKEGEDTEPYEVVTKDSDGKEIKGKIDMPIGQRPVFSGLNLKWPWEEQVDEEIHLSKAVPISKTTPLIIPEKKDAAGNILIPGGGKIFVEWIGAVTPLANQFLVMFHRTDADAFKKIVEAEVEIKLTEIIAEIVEKDKEPEKFNLLSIITRQKELFGNLHAQIYGGDTIDIKEKSHGRRIDSLTVASVRLEEGLQNAIEANSKADNVAKALETVAGKVQGTLAEAMVVAAVLGTELPDGFFAAIGNHNKGQGKGNRKNRQGGGNQDEQH